ncbi:hypothetical protein RJT34_29771 [Clitoria ternatea]|uniref:Uncharacterized protein n=1 Tax=Clitoria ternatea TaxID=43366 RepID=A0AAN9HZT2_CLITE
MQTSADMVSQGDIAHTSLIISSLASHPLVFSHVLTLVTLWRPVWCSLSVTVSSSQPVEGIDIEDSGDADSLSGSNSGLSNRQDEVGDECRGLAEFNSGSSVKYSFSKFSFKKRLGYKQKQRLLKMLESEQKQKLL